MDIVNGVPQEAYSMSQKQSSICQLISASDVALHVDKLVLVDVRSRIEFETEHIAESINVPLDDLETRFNEVPRDADLVVICRTGKRAERAAYSLLGKGFRCKVLDGGLMAWRKADLPVKEGAKRISIERQIQLIVGLGVLAGVLMASLVSPWFLLIPMFFGLGLTFAGLTGTCALGILLGKAPWNKLQ
jgi:rhodanese-related sulfurtransferase